ncbi:MAG: class SAM-dependent methyltransferase [Parcubacteria group bacterium]|nr:class SAM-dependent methyltransferase [Parcubacteria group bacterium]
MSEHNWEQYYEQTKETPPRPSLVNAVELVQDKHEALDLGSGALNDTRYLLSVGFEHVTAVDKNPVSGEVLEQLPAEKVTYEISSFEDFDFVEGAYDLINAQYSLPFTSKGKFNDVIQSIIKSLKPGGVFVGQFFGDRDEWNVEGRDMTFQTKEEAESLLQGLKIAEFSEEEKDGKTAAGETKHWHVFHFIAVK